MGKLEGKVALVTGASRGIGAEIAKRLAKEGAAVAVNYASSRDRAKAVVDDIGASGGKAFMVEADVTDLDAISRMFDQIREHADRIDVLVNNAGQGGGFNTFDQVTPEAYDKVFALNTRGVFFVMQGAAKIMRDGGRIITISSMASRIHLPGISTYAASKAAIDAFTRIIAAELAPRRITINSVQVGTVATELTAKIDAERLKHLVSMIPMGRIGEPADIADVVAFLASEDSRWITGAEIPVAGGRYV